MKAETRFIRQIQKMASDVEFQSKHVRDGEKDFKRTRKLTFSDVIMYTIGNTRSPLELEVTITDGKVISVGFPHLDLNTKPTMGQSQMVVDVTIEANSKTATYSIPENLSVTYAGDVVLSTDKQGLMAEVEQMKNTAEKILESVPKQKEVVDKTTALLSELNPIYKEKKETEQRFSKIEESISRMESTVNNFINSFSHAQSNSNTAQ